MTSFPSSEVISLPTHGREIGVRVRLPGTESQNIRHPVGEQELEQKAQAAAVSRAAPGTTNLQTVEACSTGQAATVQTGTACEDRDAEKMTISPTQVT